jgi:nicotinamide-nucleotide amidase
VAVHDDSAARAHRPTLNRLVDSAEADLAERAVLLQTRCLARAATVAVAESCTGGLVAHAITSVPGASGYFLGGVVSYADAVKEGVLGVPDTLIRTHGAVSAQVAVAMAVGVRERLGAGFGAGVTGVAGPDGGSPSKPVGLVYVAVADESGTDVRRYQWAGDRMANIQDSAVAVLDLLLERTDRLSDEPT